MTSVFFKNINPAPSWAEFLQNEQTKAELAKLENTLTPASRITPALNLALRFFELDLHKTRVVIIGQDPYPAPDIATGRAFEVGGLNSWSLPFRQASLKNIIRAVYAAYYDELLPFNKIRELTENGAFSLAPPNRLFKEWENQGVLLLNAALTCDINSPNSHRDIWRGFTNLLFQYISEKTPSYWFLWGAFAARYKSLVKTKAYVCNHPAFAGQKNDNDFFKCACFKDTKTLVDWRGLPLLEDVVK